MEAQLEIEVKFYVTDIQPARQAAMALRAESLGRFFETNILLDDRENSLFKNNCLLRLRRDQKCRVTFKAPVTSTDPDHHEQHAFKILNEIEIEVDDFERTRELFASLGFSPVRRYEKYRESLILKNTRICIDTMPFGNFIEIEGEKKDIRTIAKHLGFSWENRITANYVEIFEAIKNKAHLTFSDITFKAFHQEVKNRIHPILNDMFGTGQ
ncbi:MAG: class IV adenylate cyclase [Desulfobacterales bacterium]